MVENLKSVKNVVWQRASSLYNKQSEWGRKTTCNIISFAAQEVNPDEWGACCQRHGDQIITQHSTRTTFILPSATFSAIPTSAGRRPAKNSISVTYCCLSCHFFQPMWWMFKVSRILFFFLNTNVWEATDYASRDFSSGFFQSCCQKSIFHHSFAVQLICRVVGKIQENLLEFHCATRNW